MLDVQESVCNNGKNAHKTAHGWLPAFVNEVRVWGDSCDSHIFKGHRASAISIDGCQTKGSPRFTEQGIACLEARGRRGNSEWTEAPHPLARGVFQALISTRCSKPHVESCRVMSSTLEVPTVCGANFVVNKIPLEHHDSLILSNSFKFSFKAKRTNYIPTFCCRSKLVHPPTMKMAPARLAARTPDIN